jgi:pSer/pThr/pTyr-binding forkhead associated (FHA) protein
VAKLFVEDEGRSLLVDLRPDDTLVVGRSAACTIAIEARRASRRHLEIRPHPDGGHAAEDLGSTNGTLRNGEPMRALARLGDGDVLDAGGCRLVYHEAP